MTTSNEHIHSQDIIDFVFSQKVLHPKSFARLVVYARYGPARNGLLMGGPGRTHALTESELCTMEQDIIEDEILSAYVTSPSALSSTEKAELLSSVKVKDFKVQQLTEAQVLRILNTVKDEDGWINFAALQDKVESIVSERQRNSRKLYPDVIKGGIRRLPFDTSVVMKATQRGHYVNFNRSQTR
eukprot:TRINITY_DN2625_c0_g1_i2.p1 TRINITY_DN2625_c0_g1~~TRINITY_DN2625_c0_g1_i2.p1  ORF type:complete len:185 (-),score=10.59 TRINITY_DN2625_c0_g1_i2:234-788(-)